MNINTLFGRHRDWVVLHDHPDDVMSGLSGVVMASHLCSLLEGWFEKFTGEFILTFLTGLGGDLAPHVGDKNDVLQCRVTTKFTEHSKIPWSDSGKLHVGDAVDVDDPGKLRLFLMPIKKFSSGD